MTSSLGDPVRPHILSVVGARPQFIKAAVVSRALAALGIREDLLHTGQHFDDNMSGSFFRELGIPKPKLNLEVGSGSHAEQTAGVLIGVEREIVASRPAGVLIYGDTNSTLGAALAAAKLHVPVFHVEAGLRSRNRRMPEEINRIVADQVSSMLFSPTPLATSNLVSEGVPAGKIVQVGDVMYDAVLHARRSLEVGEARGQHILMTIHRAENTDDEDRLRAIFSAADELAIDNRVIMPLHPRTAKVLEKLGIRPAAGVEMIEPVGYGRMMRLQASATVIITDSGGVQKEAYFHGVPCVTVRTETEWLELVEAGWNRLADPSSAHAIVEAVREGSDPQRRAEWTELYGDGTAGVQIATAIASFWDRLS